MRRSSIALFDSPWDHAATELMHFVFRAIGRNRVRDPSSSEGYSERFRELTRRAAELPPRATSDVGRRDRSVDGEGELLRQVFPICSAAVSSAPKPSPCATSALIGWNGVPSVYGVAPHSSQVCGTTARCSCSW